MAKWRTKAYDTFGFKLGSYSYGDYASLFADLFLMAKDAALNQNEQLLLQIFDYAIWVDAQNSEGLRSAADIEFFMPALKDENLREAAKSILSSELLAQKQQLINGNI